MAGHNPNSTGRDAAPYKRIAPPHAHHKFREFWGVELAARVFESNGTI